MPDPLNNPAAKLVAKVGLPLKAAADDAAHRERLTLGEWVALALAEKLERPELAPRRRVGRRARPNPIITTDIDAQLKQLVDRAAAAAGLPINEFVARVLAERLERPELAVIPRNATAAEKACAPPKAPPPQPPPATPAKPGTLGVIMDAYLAHLALKVQAGKIVAAHQENVSRAVTDFGLAWRVRLHDGTGPGTQALVRWQDAATGSDAIAQVKAATGRPLCGMAVRNRDVPLAQATRDDLTRWLLANPQWQAGWTQCNNLLAIVTCFRWHEEETGERVPYRRSALPDFDKRSRRAAERHEYIALMRHTSSRELRRALYALWNLQGIRTCEMRGLLWTDFRSERRGRQQGQQPSVLGDDDFAWERAFILIAKHKTRKKTGKPKLIALTRRQARWFAALYRQRPAGVPHVFLNTEGGPWTRDALAKHLRNTARRIGLDDGIADRISAYCFRHTFATEADAAGMPQARTALLLGHQGTEMLNRVYSKVASKPDVMRDAAETAERLRREARKADGGPHAGGNGANGANGATGANGTPTGPIA